MQSHINLYYLPYILDVVINPFETPVPSFSRAQKARKWQTLAWIHIGGVYDRYICGLYDRETFIEMRVSPMLLSKIRNTRGRCNQGFAKFGLRCF